MLYSEFIICSQSEWNCTDLEKARCLYYDVNILIVLKCDFNQHSQNFVIHYVTASDMLNFIKLTLDDQTLN